MLYMTNLNRIVKPLLCLSIVFIFSAHISAAATNQAHANFSLVKKIAALFQHKKSQNKNINNKDSNNPRAAAVTADTATTPTQQVTPITPSVVASDPPPDVTPPKTTPQPTPQPTAITKSAASTFIPTAYAAPSINGLYSNQNFSRATTKLLNEIAIVLAVLGLLLIAGGDRLVRSKVSAENFNSNNQLSST